MQHKHLQQYSLSFIYFGSTFAEPKRQKEINTQHKLCSAHNLTQKDKEIIKIGTKQNHVNIMKLI